MAPNNIILGDDTIVRLDQLIDNIAVQQPNKVALRYHQNNYTYKELNSISGRLALYFKDAQIKKGDVIGVALNRSPELILVLLAIIKAGATYLPIDIALPANRINYMLGNAGAKFLISSQSFGLAGEVILQNIFIEDAWAQYNKYEPGNYKFETTFNELAYILYTSGSTGNPKGVQVKHSNLLNLLLSIQQSPGANSSDNMLATTTISFDIAALEIFLPLISGATLILVDTETVKDGRLLLDLAKREAATIMQGTPAMWQNLLNSGWAYHLPIKAFCGGETMPKNLAQSLLPKCNQLWNMYGPTETTIYSVIKHITTNDAVNTITIGKPIRNTQVYILDEHQNQVETGQSGEIYIGGAGVALGYVNNQHLTDERFIDDKFTLGGKIYRSGDLGSYLENGDIEYLGRIDQQIKIRGFRIEPGEIEHHLKKLAGVKEALVTSFKDFFGETHLGVYVVVSENATDIANYPAIWKAGLRKNVPDYMVPDTYKIVAAIPRLVNGKIDWQALAPLTIGENIADNYEQAQSETETFLTQILLNHIALNKIGINDNFFEVGLTSLAAVQIMVQIEQLLCKRLPLSTLIQYPTIKNLAAFLDSDTPGSAFKALVPIKPNGTKIPLYIVHGIGLNLLNLRSMVSNMDNNQPVYGLQPAGLNGADEPLDDMESIAKLYIDEITEHNPLGPYAIAGYSFGGYIAYEMARQLKLAGKKIVMLGMFDSNIQTPIDQPSKALKLKFKLARQLNKIIFRAETIIKHPFLTAEYLKVYYRNKIADTLIRYSLLKVYNPDKLPAYMLTIIRKLETAFKKYKIQPLDIKIELFKADVRLFFVDDPIYLGWAKYAQKGVNVYNVPGDHKHMFSKPNDEILARVLQDKLNELNLENDTKRYTLL